MEVTENKLLEGPGHLTDTRHPVVYLGPMVGLYLWQYPLRLIHWGIVISIGVLAFTGYYIHDPFIVGQVNHPFYMGWFRFVHETFGMIFWALFLVRMYLFFQGNRFENWRAYVPLHRSQFKEMVNVAKFYLFINPRPVSKIGHNAMAAFSYIALYAMVFVEIVTGMVMFNWLRHSPILTPLVGWIPRMIALPNIRLIHFLLMFCFISFGIFHVHLAVLISREEKHGMMDSIFTGYKVIPAHELEEEEERAVRERK